MAARFNDTNIRALVQSLAHHVQTCAFTPEAIEELHMKTDLTITQILKWAEAVCYFIPAEMREQWLRNNGAFQADGKASLFMSFNDSELD